MIVEVTGPRRLENGLVVPGKFTAFTKGATIGQKLKGTDDAHKRTLQAYGDGNTVCLSNLSNKCCFHETVKFLPQHSTKGSSCL